MEQPAYTAGMRTLSSLATGDRARVMRIDGGRQLTARLTAMGLVPGTPVEVVSSNGGPMVLSVAGSRLVVGRGIAMKVHLHTLKPTVE